MKKMSLIALFAMALSACQTTYIPQAREVKKKPRQNGVIAMPSNYRPEDRAKADSLMQSNCSPLAFNVTDEGETVVGQETKGTSSATNRDDTRQSAGALFGIPLMTGSAGGTDTHNSSVTKAITEWQVTYNCDAPEKAAKAKK
ncbi:hypothetical protein D3C87_1610190 [compost metagenome]